MADLRQRSLQQVVIGRTKIALSHHEGVFGAVSGVCNHAGGPLGEGMLEGDLSSVPGITGNSIASPGRASRATRRTRCPGMP